MGLEVIFASTLSLVAIILSIFSLYYSHLQKANIKAYEGEIISFWYINKIPRVDFSITFINKGVRSGVITKVALDMYKKNESDNKHSFDWLLFYKISAEGGELRSVADDLPYPLNISGKSSITKRISFEGPKEFQFTEGVWILIFKILYKSKNLDSPDITIKKEISFDEGEAILFADRWISGETKSWDKRI